MTCLSGVGEAMGAGPWGLHPCTKVQVFHREYRENEAKIRAKVVMR
jgi:hypothetical protein